MANYRPISNISFMLKIIERVVATRVKQHLLKFDVWPSFQSAYRQNHSTEAALLRILSDVFEAADHGKVTTLVMLDSSDAFDCVDHGILLTRLERQFGFCDKVD